MSQRAAVAVEYEKVFAAEAKKRQVAELAQNRDHTVKENFPERAGAQASDEAGDLFQVSGRSVRDAKYVAEH